MTAIMLRSHLILFLNLLQSEVTTSLRCYTFSTDLLSTRRQCNSIPQYNNSNHLSSSDQNQKETDIFFKAKKLNAPLLLLFDFQGLSFKSIDWFDRTDKQTKKNCQHSKDYIPKCTYQIFEILQLLTNHHLKYYPFLSSALANCIILLDKSEFIRLCVVPLLP